MCVLAGLGPEESQYGWEVEAFATGSKEANHEPLVG